MKHSDQLDALATALSAAQGEFEAVAKDSKNPFFKSTYAALPTVVQAASPILATHGLAVTQLLGHDVQGDTLTTVLLHKSGQFISDTMHLRPVKDDPQAQGSATTYGRRYAYMAALGLVADEDDDGNAGSSGTRKPAAAKSKATISKPPTAASVESVKADLAASLVDQPLLGQISAAAKTLWPTRDEMREKLKWELISIEGVEFDPNDPDPSAVPKVMEGLTLQQGMDLLQALEAKVGAA
jgi:hypothetical protein